MTGGGTMKNTAPLLIWHDQAAEFFSCSLKGEGAVCPRVAKLHTELLYLCKNYSLTAEQAGRTANFLKTVP